MGTGAPVLASRTAVAGTLAIAAACWVVAAAQTATMVMAMAGLVSFLGLWVVMMAAMMLPSTAPLAAGYAARDAGRPLWPARLILLGAVYLSVWAVIGAAAYALMPLLPSGVDTPLRSASLVVAGVYGLTPIQRAFRMRCRALCGAVSARSPLRLGIEYGLNCIGCSGAVMLAFVLLGAANLAWMAIFSGVLVTYKLAPVNRWLEPAIASTLIAAGLALIV